MKILPELKLGTRKSPLNFQSHPESADFCQPNSGAPDQIVTADHIFILPKVDLGTRKSPLNFGRHSENGDLGPTILHPTR